MELRDFVEQTLTQIVDGVAAAQRASAESGARINAAPRTGNSAAGILLHRTSQSLLQMIDFDVAISVTGETAGGGKAQISVATRVLNASLGGDVSGRSESSTVHRVKFSVPIVFPNANGAADPAVAVT